MSQICGIISNSGRFFEPLACAFEVGHDGIHSWGTLPTFGRTDVATQLAEVEELIRLHQDKQRFSQGFGSTAERTKAVLRVYEDKAIGALSSAKQVRDDLLTYFRALVLVLTMTGEAATHAEKNARLRGAVELLESAIRDLRNRDMEQLFSSFRWPDLFRSDWPTRRLMERLHDLERENKELRGESNDTAQTMTARATDEQAVF